MKFNLKSAWQLIGSAWSNPSDSGNRTLVCRIQLILISAMWRLPTACYALKLFLMRKQLHGDSWKWCQNLFSTIPVILALLSDLLALSISYCFVLKSERVKEDYSRKSRPNFGLFNPLLELGGWTKYRIEKFWPSPDLWYAVAGGWTSRLSSCSLKIHKQKIIGL